MGRNFFLYKRNPTKDVLEEPARIRSIGRATLFLSLTSGALSDAASEADNGDRYR